MLKTKLNHEQNAFPVMFWIVYRLKNHTGCL